jgi:D-glycero-D-manno-heptose 1,7-bisphosphate phosphatase
LTTESARAVFLDRDGTIIRDLEYLGDPAEMEFLPGAPEALRTLHEAGFLLVVITNQSGVARGLFDEAACREVNDRFVEVLAGQGVPVTAVYYCPHLPGAAVPEYDMECECRKPGTALFRQAAEEFDIDFARSWAVGDSLRDLQPAKKLGARTVLVLTGKGAGQASLPEARSAADRTAADIREAAEIIIESADSPHTP